ncbi:MAG TPA: hypothetical protein VKZ53_08870 [Candidatus Angelobacter sp.]|nr:hypothetical protein [Candidatus Angelobacter sp.]
MPDAEQLCRAAGALCFLWYRYPRLRCASPVGYPLVAPLALGASREKRSHPTKSKISTTQVTEEEPEVTEKGVINLVRHLHFHLLIGCTALAQILFGEVLE